MAGEYDWLGALLGGAAGYMGSQGGNTTTQTGGVSPQFQPLAGAAAQRGMDIGAMPYTPYQYNTVAGFNPYQFAGMDMTAQRAQQQGGLPQAAESALGNTLGGNYLGSGNPYAGANPYLEQNIQNTMGDMSKTYNQQVAPTMAATAYKSGSFGNSGQQEMENQSRNMLQQNLGRVSGDMRMQDYGQQQNMWGQERNRMMQGLGQASNINGLGYAGADRMLGIGGTMQQQGQNELTGQYQQWQDAQNWPFKTGGYMNTTLNGGGAGSQQQTTAPGQNPVAGVLGGAMFGSQLFGQGNPNQMSNYGLPNYAVNPYGY
jgi:hypothetical protein